MAQSTPAPPASVAEQSTALATHPGSLYSPSLDSSLDMTCTPVSRGRAKGVSPLQKMNEFLESKDISPVRYPATVPWSRGKRENTKTSLAQGPPSSGCTSLGNCGKPSLRIALYSTKIRPAARKTQKWMLMRF